MSTKKKTIFVPIVISGVGALLLVLLILFFFGVFSSGLKGKGSGELIQTPPIIIENYFLEIESLRVGLGADEFITDELALSRVYDTLLTVRVPREFLDQHLQLAIKVKGWQENIPVGVKMNLQEELKKLVSI